MVKKSLKRKMIIKAKEKIARIVLFFLYRGFKVTYKEDLRVKGEINSWEEGFTVSIQTGMKGLDLIMKKEAEELVRLRQVKKADLEITFKSIDAAFLMFTGRLGVSKAYAEHRFTLKGDIGVAMSFVRCIDTVEAYLFPKIISKHILKEVPKKSIGLVRTYGEVLKAWEH